MANRSHAINYLENHDLQKQVLDTKPEDAACLSVLNVLKHLENSGMTGKQPDLGFYRYLAAEYDRYLQKEYLDNITLEITGVGNTRFADDNQHLIDEAARRLESSPFGSQMDFFMDNSELTVLWFPTTPIKLADLGPEKLDVIKSNIRSYFANALDLVVSEVSFSIIDGGGGREDFFYDYYFAPRMLMGILEGNAIPQSSYDSNGEKTIMGYLRDGGAELLKAAVNSRLSGHLGFDIDLPDMFEPTGHTVFFMPFFKACLRIRPDQSAETIKGLVNRHFDVLESKAFNDHLYLECRAQEGPYAESVSDILQNINGILSPYVMRVLGELGLEVLSVLFILTDTEH